MQHLQPEPTGRRVRSLEEPVVRVDTIALVGTMNSSWTGLLL